MSLKVNILEIVCIVHANDLLADWVPPEGDAINRSIALAKIAGRPVYIGSYIRHNVAYPIFGIMKGGLFDDI